MSAPVNLSAPNSEPIENFSIPPHSLKRNVSYLVKEHLNAPRVYKVTSVKNNGKRVNVFLNGHRFVMEHPYKRMHNGTYKYSYHPAKYYLPRENLRLRTTFRNLLNRQKTGKIITRKRRSRRSTSSFQGVA